MNVTIEDSCFYGCSGLKEIIIPSSVEKIMPNAFYTIGDDPKIYFEETGIWQLTSKTAYGSNYNAENNYYTSLGGAKKFDLTFISGKDYSDYFDGIALYFSLPNNSVQRYLKTNECTWTKQ